ncbi:MAG: hypothetical protein K1060chlam2_00750 [Chlamydiae bacterium]|nr:hypothetical protein [Chlamydiota bacterium]
MTIPPTTSSLFNLLTDEPLTPFRSIDFLTDEMNETILSDSYLFPEDHLQLFKHEGLSRIDYEGNISNCFIQNNERGNGNYVRLEKQDCVMIWINLEGSRTGKYNLLILNDLGTIYNVEDDGMFSDSFSLFFESCKRTDKAPRFTMKIEKVTPRDKAKAVAFLDRKNHNMLPVGIRDFFYPRGYHLEDRELQDEKIEVLTKLFFI